MAQLSSASIDALAESIQAWASRNNIEYPSVVDKAQLRQFVVDVDSGLDTAEISILDTVTNLTVRNWLKTSRFDGELIGRAILEQVAETRKETL